MFINKSILGGALTVCQVDKEFPQLNCICIESDGTIIAINKMVRYVAEPVHRDIVQRIPFGNKEILSSKIILSAETATHLYKSIPINKVFGVILEHASITKGEKGLVSCETHDGQRTQKMNLHSLNQDFFNWKSEFGSLYPEPYSIDVLNRKRLLSAITALDSACKYDGSFSPVFVKRCINGKILWRCINELTGQRVLILFTNSQIKEPVPELNEWERSTLSMKKIIFKRKVPVVVL